MALKDRKTLKNYFEKGSVPKKKAFHDLIDSAVNKIDDDVLKTKNEICDPDSKREIDITGWIASKGRFGNYSGNDTVPADGEWHAITPWLNYCQAFEIIARTGIKDTGKHAIMHAIALSAYGNSRSSIRSSRSSIRKTRSWYDFLKPVKLQLRWAGSTYKYRLEMRCKQNLGDNVYIKYFITQLWSDEKMWIKKK